MYDELVKRMRNCTSDTVEDCAGCPYIRGYNGTYCMNGLVTEAADAIEALSVVVRAQKAVLDKFPRWIPVTERLPQSERKSYWVCTDTGYQCECRWTNDRFGIRESDEWSWNIFDIPQYQKVAAWMSLPDPYEPQKEGNP